MSKDGKYQYACGVNYIHKSRNYGILWVQSLNLSGTWNSISCSDNGEYVIFCAENNKIRVSQDYCVSFTMLLVASGKTLQTVKFLDGGKIIVIYQITDGKFYISRDFGTTWTEFLTGITNYRFYAISDSLQYSTFIYNDTIITSNLIGSGERVDIPGLINIPTQHNINDNAVILLSGSSSNTYSYETNNTNSFNILSSDLDDSGSVSYAILSYGETIN
jgi:hypothetical protein